MTFLSLFRTLFTVLLFLTNVAFIFPFISPNQFLYAKILSSASTVATLSSQSRIVDIADSTNISEILRTYIENKFEFNAMEIPTNDIIKELKKIIINKHNIESIRTVLYRADNIKYAKGLSLEKENTCLFYFYFILI